MITLVTGGSGSGKSEYAEQQLMRSPCIRRIYVATMIAYGQEGRDKVLRHQVLRHGKGFITLEKPRDVGGLVLENLCGVDGFASEQSRDTDRRMSEQFYGSAVLLECVSNLAANEMFEPDCGEGGTRDIDCLAVKIEEDIRCLARQARDMVIVTNEVGADGAFYERETKEYIRLMGLLNQRLALVADRVVEVVCGIPVVQKPCFLRYVAKGMGLWDMNLQRAEIQEDTRGEEAEEDTRGEEAEEDTRGEEAEEDTQGEEAEEDAQGEEAEEDMQGEKIQKDTRRKITREKI